MYADKRKKYLLRNSGRPPKNPSLTKSTICIQTNSYSKGRCMLTYTIRCYTDLYYWIFFGAFVTRRTWSSVAKRTAKLTQKYSCKLFCRGDPVRAMRRCVRTCLKACVMSALWFLIMCASSHTRMSGPGHWHDVHTKTAVRPRKLRTDHWIRSRSIEHIHTLE